MRQVTTQQQAEAGAPVPLQTWEPGDPEVPVYSVKCEAAGYLPYQEILDSRGSDTGDGNFPPMLDHDRHTGYRDQQKVAQALVNFRTYINLRAARKSRRQAATDYEPLNPADIEDELQRRSLNLHEHIGEVIRSTKDLQSAFPDWQAPWIILLQRFNILMGKYDNNEKRRIALQQKQYTTVKEALIDTFLIDTALRKKSLVTQGQDQGEMAKFMDQLSGQVAEDFNFDVIEAVIR